VTFTGSDGETAYVEVNGVNYQVANEAGAFAWDADDAQGGRHVFTFVTETISRTAAGVNFTVTWDGTAGGLAFTVHIT